MGHASRDADLMLDAILPPGFPHKSSIKKIFQNSKVETRYSVRPIMENAKPTDFKHRNDLYIEWTKKLGMRAAKEALDNANMKPTDIDYVITTSCTGFMIPSLDAYLINDMGMRRNTKRLPITELGCAGGAQGIARAGDFIKAHPGSTVLLLAVELPSLTVQADDFSMTNLVAASLFGDGCAACVITDKPRTGAKIISSDSYIFQDSYHFMGFDTGPGGFTIVLDKDIPDAVTTKVAPVLAGMCAPFGCQPAQLDFFVFHPGGRKVLENMEQVFGIPRERIKASWDCLWECGNLSSASVIVVYKHLYERYRPKHGQRGLLTAFGPGFSAEGTLLEWQEV
ncbi:MAG: type III polyketide synthase [Deltaproteobacteria bacterium]|nr:type III polyketide synthase [Deltaproteobacteria bacterium]